MRYECPGCGESFPKEGFAEKRNLCKACAEYALEGGSFCGECGRRKDTDWSYCPYCGSEGWD